MTRKLNVKKIFLEKLTSYLASQEITCFCRTWKSITVFI